MPLLPIQAARACIRRSNRFLETARNNELRDSKIKNDLRRSALTMAVAALDAYMHWTVLRQLSAVRKAGALPNALAKLNLPFSEIARLAESAIAGRRSEQNIRPWVQIKHSLQKRLYQQTFQSYDDVAHAFALAGVKKGWERVAKKLSARPSDIKKKLDALVYRRNQIVHEGDIIRASRPQHLKYNDIHHGAVAKQVKWVNTVLSAIEAVVVEGK